jgi:hypothetical protein
VSGLSNFSPSASLIVPLSLIECFASASLPNSPLQIFGTFVLFYEMRLQEMSSFSAVGGGTALLIPYMAIRSYQRPYRDLLVEASTNAAANSSGTNVQMSGLQRFMVSGAQQIAFTGAVVGIVSMIWFVFGRLDGGYGDLAERWDYFLGHIGSDRPTYAFIWDLCCYTIFQPWLIRDNYQNVRRDRLETVKALHLVPYVGLVAYCWGLESIEGLGKVKKNA